MFVKDLLEKLENIKKQENALKQERKNLVDQAKKERVLEVNIVDFAEKLTSILHQDDFKISANKICIPSSLCNKMEEAKNYIYYELNTSVVEEVMLWLSDLKGE